MNAKERKMNDNREVSSNTTIRALNGIESIR